MLKFISFLTVILSFLIIINQKSFAQKEAASLNSLKSVTTVGTVSVKTWEGNRKSAFSFTFDASLTSMVRCLFLKVTEKILNLYEEKNRVVV